MILCLKYGMHKQKNRLLGTGVYQHLIRLDITV
jgi:hypothetical protein